MVSRLAVRKLKHTHRVIQDCGTIIREDIGETRVENVNEALPLTNSSPLGSYNIFILTFHITLIIKRRI
jgi:hypothetical protein